MLRMFDTILYHPTSTEGVGAEGYVLGVVLICEPTKKTLTVAIAVPTIQNNHKMDKPIISPRKVDK